MVIIAKRAGKIKEFQEEYREEVKALKQQAGNNIKSTFKDSSEYRKNKALLKAIEHSF